ncbi:MAG: 1-acyl-sn-glycerol-3-phosphate acyltransferase [Clostridia bacterium]|nr:1-acyl-sn-glycerol-3-phosphate acyltransferase [Clostridia bacterium]
MLRLIYVIIMRIGSIMYFVPKMRKYARHPEIYTEEDCHELAKVMIRKVAKTARITTKVYDAENLPSEGGFVLFSNHQSKFDALGIMEALPRPCRVLMDLKRSKMPLANEYVALVRGKRLDKSNIRQQVTCFREISEEVADGKVYLVFPEGGYVKGQTNRMGVFHGGCFRTAVRAKAPIVPVALVDLYKTFGRNSLRKVSCQVYFLPAIPYEEYQHMTSAALAGRVQADIAQKIREVTGEDVMPASSDTGVNLQNISMGA